MSRIQTDAKSLQRKKTIPAVHLKFCLDNTLDTQTHITKQPIQDAQILNINPASPVHLTQNLKSPTKQVTSYKLSTKLSSYTQTRSCSASIFVSK